MKRAKKTRKAKPAAPKKKKKIRRFPSGFKIGRGFGGVRTAKKK